MNLTKESNNQAVQVPLAQMQYKVPMYNNRTDNPMDPKEVGNLLVTIKKSLLGLKKLRQL